MAKAIYILEIQNLMVEFCSKESPSLSVSTKFLNTGNKISKRLMKQYFIKSFGIYKNIGSISKFCDFIIDESTITCTIQEKYRGFLQTLCENKFTFEFEFDAKDSSNFKTMWQTSLTQFAQIINKQFNIQEKDFYECILKIGTVYTANEMKK